MRVPRHPRQDQGSSLPECLHLFAPQIPEHSIPGVANGVLSKSCSARDVLLWALRLWDVLLRDLRMQLMLRHVDGMATRR